VLSKIVVASTRQGAALAAGSFASDSVNSIDTGGLDSAAFMSLHMLALGNTLDELLPEYDPIAQGSDQGPWVFSLPIELQSHLSSLDSISVEQLAESWATSDELCDDEVETEKAVSILSEVANLARSAQSSGTGLLLWLSR
jgi:hypothetical protein